MVSSTSTSTSTSISTRVNPEDIHHHRTDDLRRVSLFLVIAAAVGVVGVAVSSASTSTSINISTSISTRANPEDFRHHRTDDLRRVSLFLVVAAAVGVVGVAVSSASTSTSISISTSISTRVNPDNIRHHRTDDLRRVSLLPVVAAAVGVPTQTRAYGGLCGMPACGQAVGLWCLRDAGALAWRRGPVCACTG